VGESCVTKSAVTDAIKTNGIYAIHDGVELALGSSSKAALTPTNINLYQCNVNANADVTCTPTYGYLKFNDGYCTVSAKTTNSCGSVDGACTEGSDVGKLYNNSNDLLCIDGVVGNGIQFSEGGNGYLLTDKFGTFSENNKVVVKVNENSITLVVQTGNSLVIDVGDSKTMKVVDSNDSNNAVSNDGFNGK